MVKEEIDILLTLSEAVEKRTPPDASEEERQALAEELLHEDAELERLLKRLEELVRANDESVILTLESLERDEGDEGEEPSPGRDSNS